MKDIKQILSSLGLLDSEIKTYLAALKSGASTVLDLAKSTHLSRQGVYTAIQQLTDRGLMTSVQKGKKQFYSAEDPEKLLSYAQRKEKDLEERIKDLKKSLPDLKLRMGGDKPIVRYFQGKEGLRTIIDEMTEGSTKEVFEIADLDAMKKVLSKEDLAPLKKTNIRQKKKVYGFYSGKFEKSGVQTTYYPLPKEYSNSKSSIILYGDHIALVTFEGNMHSIMIESKPLAKTLRTLFELSKKAIEKS